MGAMQEPLQAGAPASKTYTCSEDFRLEAEEMQTTMHTVAPAGGMMTGHCEDDDIIQSAQTQSIDARRIDPSVHPVSRRPEAELIAIGHVVRPAASAACRQ